jgi:integrase/recombinase XerD
MKRDRCGQAKVLTQEELTQLFTEGLVEHPVRDRALFAICLFTACRINECVTLKVSDVYDRRGRILSEVTFRKGNTKGKLSTRSVPVTAELLSYLEAYHPPDPKGFLFPGGNGKPHLHPHYAALILRRACRRIELEGVSTHSFRRTALTQMSDAGIPLRIVQSISGHRSLEELQKYLEIRDQQKLGAVSTLSLIAPTSQSSPGTVAKGAPEAIDKSDFVDPTSTPRPKAAAPPF